METQQEKKYFSSSDTKEDSNKLESRYQFCGHTLRITWDSSNNLVIPAIIWEAGLVLCRFFEKENINFSGKKMIELGSGTGILGILAIRLGGDVTLTDKPEVLNQIELNVANNVPSSIIHRSKVSALSWGENHDQFPTDYDIILGSDIVYKKREFQLLRNTLQHLSSQNTIIYICSKMRPHLFFLPMSLVPIWTLPLRNALPLLRDNLDLSNREATYHTGVTIAAAETPISSPYN
ncbi:EEF1A lysine methyltransferase 3-like [Heptranchias perlo]|uniref:EEF1A lysine methyltransferase 3-like n=1 Tax=Heptranchias perlo TaxID=212740 RepID=UPI003559916D